MAPRPAARTARGRRELLCMCTLVTALFSRASAAWGQPPLHCQNGGTPANDGDRRPVCNCGTPPNATHPFFFRGRSCEVPATLCADAETFYCANGATCVEVVQAEQYRCDGCQGFGGDHCDEAGVACGGGGLVCFNGGTCRAGAEGPLCACPAEFSGNATCTQRRLPAESASLAPDEPVIRQDESSDSVLWPVVVVVVFSILGIAVGSYLGYPHIKDRLPAARSDARFQPIRKEDDDDRFQLGDDEEEGTEL